MATTGSAYHWSTAYDRYNMTPHTLDWDNQPVPFKDYPAITPVALPDLSRVDLPGMSLERAVRGPASEVSPPVPGLSDLSRIFGLACGLMARARQPGGDFYFRSAPSAGALYPSETYLAWPGSVDLSAGLYHYGVHHGGLTPLRDGEAFAAVRQALVPESAPNCPVFLVSGIFFRSAWKYRARAYRYLLLDGGHLLENLRLAMGMAGYSGTQAFDFNDTAINQALGLDRDREVILGALIMKAGSAELPTTSQPPAMPPVKADLPGASRVSAREIIYDGMQAVHRAGETIASRSALSNEGFSFQGITPQFWQALPDPPWSRAAPGASFAGAAIRRRSRRNFVNRPMTEDQFACLLDLVCCTHRADALPAQSPVSVACGCLVGNVAGVKPGFYVLDTASRRLGHVFGEDLRTAMAAICLDQAWLANASVHVALFANIEAADRQWGPRGYRYAMMTAGRLGHAVYLSATALGLGCCGIGAFYDSEAAQLLGLNDNAAMVYLLGVGPVKAGES